MSFKSITERIQEMFKFPTLIQKVELVWWQFFQLFESQITENKDGSDQVQIKIADWYFSRYKLDRTAPVLEIQELPYVLQYR